MKGKGGKGGAGALFKVSGGRRRKKEGEGLSHFLPPSQLTTFVVPRKGEREREREGELEEAGRHHPPLVTEAATTSIVQRGKKVGNHDMLV